ncbi:hypothetical protein HN840_00955 [archaeon]|jgi:hypothetical protein|nr:hypothetical protein [archaeon]MBT3731283.1 hypothetical protein [archaeon]MBT4669936.1 hypothetical protein [archaeon]MBT5029761.1 hypothetical protein [archaeon]MBT5287490.1 hypothetical protein [archaeon]
MKKSVIFLFVILVLTQCVSATVEFDELNTQYNIGDEIAVFGTIKADEEFSGYLQTSFVCDGQKYNLQSISLDLKKDEEVYLFELSLPSVIVSSSLKGLCWLELDLLTSGVSVDNGRSSNFEVTTDLNGKFSLEEDELQLGETLKITGTISQLDGDTINGNAELYFANEEGEEYLVGIMEVIDGEIDYSYELLSGYAGDYNVNIIVRDSYGNKQYFEKVEKFSVESELHVFVNTNINTILPGEHINVYGNVKTVTKDYVDTGSIEIYLDGDLFSAELSDSQYTYDLWTKDNIETGEHQLKVTAKDSYGNEGSTTTRLRVSALASEVSNIIPVDEVMPGEEIAITVNLYDQTGEFMDEGNIFVKVYNANGRIAAEQYLYSGEEFLFMIPEFSEAGDWSIKSTYEGEIILEDEDVINVGIVENLDYNVVNGILYIQNTGNVRYTDDIEIEIEGDNKDFIVKKSRNLDPGETLEVDLNEEIPTGVYSLIFPTGMGVTDLDDVNVDNGKERTGVGWIYTMVALLFLVGLSYMLYARVYPKGRPIMEEGDDFIESSAMFKNKKDRPKEKIKLYDPKSAKNKKPSITFENREKSIADFRKRTLAEINRVEAMTQRKAGRAAVKSGKLGYVIGKTSDGKVGIPSPGKHTQKAEGKFFNLFE